MTTTTPTIAPRLPEIQDVQVEEGHFGESRLGNDAFLVLTRLIWKRTMAVTAILPALKMTDTTMLATAKTSLNGPRSIAEHLADQTGREYTKSLTGGSVKTDISDLK
jgi:hypothetical protein